MSVITRTPITSGIRIARIGGSIDARESVALDANITSTTASVIHVQVTSTTSALALHNLHDGAWVFLAKTNNNPPYNPSDINYIFAAGPITLIDRDEFTLPNTSGISGTTATGFTVFIPNQSAYCSVYRELSQRFNGALQLVGNFASGETVTELLYQRVPLVLASNPDIVMGTFALGDTVSWTSPSISITDAVSHLIDLIGAFIQVNQIPVVWELPTGTLNTNFGQVAKGQKIVAAVLNHFQGANNLYIAVSDPTYWSIDPSSGNVFPQYIKSGDTVHPNRLSERRRSQDLFELLQQRISYSLTPPTATSPLDRSSAAGAPTIPDKTRSNNLFCGGWDNRHTDPHALLTQASGSVMAEIDKIDLLRPNSSASPTPAVVCNYSAAPPEVGGYDQTFVFSPGSKGDTFVFWLAGSIIPSTNFDGTLSAQMRPGNGYRLFLDLAWFNPNSTDQNPIPIPTDVIQDYGITVYASVKYAAPQAIAGWIGGTVLNTSAKPTITGTPPYVWDGITKAPYWDSNPLYMSEPFDGLHFTEMMYVSANATAYTRVAIQLRIVMATNTIATNSVGVRIRHVAFRDYGLVSATGMALGVPPDPL